jgi:hypothetical protein
MVALLGKGLVGLWGGGLVGWWMVVWWVGDLAV